MLQQAIGCSAYVVDFTSAQLGRDSLAINIQTPQCTGHDQSIGTSMLSHVKNTKARQDMTRKADTHIHKQTFACSGAKEVSLHCLPC